jgi:hypothetical protein
MEATPKTLVILIAHRQRIARLLIALGVASVAFDLFVLFRLAFHYAGTLVWTNGDALRVVAELVGVMLFTALVFGAWKIAWFALRSPRVARSDWVYIVVFSGWVAYNLLVALFLTARHPGAIF